MKLRDWIPIENLDWKLLSTNPNAIDLFRENPEKIDWECLSENPDIFTYDYKKIKKTNQDLNKEIKQKYLSIQVKKLLKISKTINNNNHKRELMHMVKEIEMFLYQN